MIVLGQAVVLRSRDQAVSCLAAHLGCTIVMPLALILCALAISVPAMLIVEIAATVAAAYCLQSFFMRSPTYYEAGRRVVARIPAKSTRTEDLVRH
jgi:hypothetical protein